MDLKTKVIESPLRHKNYKIHDDKIFYKFSRTEGWKLIVPPSSRECALKECHNNPMAAHLDLSVFKTKIKSTAKI